MSSDETLAEWVKRTQEYMRSRYGDDPLYWPIVEEEDAQFIASSSTSPHADEAGLLEGGGRAMDH